jgi:hypothetical protein
MRTDERHSAVYKVFAHYLHTCPPSAATHCSGLVEHLKESGFPSTAAAPSKKRQRDVVSVDECIR